ncbi:O-antigen ligase family protein [Phototrophicus methaneseepsis]|uniref:O-antigen ligase family protein n=1 Tax=Phototrophicus methaneseepsis TaxID=2710758 RepID=A0A7S8EAE6_9CHLR|nr:O-antigen ligase family protein [Phototrophicus methaneseepsis]QPC83306.1 O-antigen ligase family protein [Phototrophicus methaneseepsis]
MTRLRTHTLPMLLLFLIFVYMYFGITFTGVVALTSLQPLTMGIFLAGALFTGVQYLRGRWKVYNTPFAPMFALWAVAFIISIVANPAYARISMEGLWYMGLFMGTMSIFISALTNKALTRPLIEEAMLLLGFVLLFIGSLQIGLIFTNTGAIPRTANPIGNPNFYAMILLIITMLALHRVLTTHSLFVQLMMGLYTLVALVHLLLSGSRGGQLGFLVALALYIGLRLFTRPQPEAETPFERLSKWLHKRTGLSPKIWIAGIFAMGIVVVLLIVFQRSRLTSGRTPLYVLAVQLFLERPLTGQGLFTFGPHMLARMSTPPNGLLPHPHSVPLAIMAELGLPGLIALGYSILAGVRAIWMSRQALIGKQLAGYDALVAILVGLSLHHLVDSAMLYVALLVLLVVVMVMTPINPIPAPRSRQIAFGISQAILWSVLCIGFLWHSSIYQPYMEILNEVRQQKAAGPVDYPAAMERLSEIMAADPHNIVYHIQYADWAGLLADQSQAKTDIETAIAAYDRLLSIEPGYGVAWANLAALHWQAGDPSSAVEALEQGMVHAPDWRMMAWQYHAYAYNHPIPQFKPIEWKQGLSSIQLVYLRDIESPLLLPQVNESAMVPLDELAARLFLGLMRLPIAVVEQ